VRDGPEIKLTARRERASHADIGYDFGGALVRLGHGAKSRKQIARNHRQRATRVCAER